VLEAMKMENEITAPISGTVISLNVKLGNTVEKGTSLLEIEPTSMMDNS
jgi:biotin carboxyl carrier protein